VICSGVRLAFSSCVMLGPACEGFLPIGPVLRLSKTATPAEEALKQRMRHNLEALELLRAHGNEFWTMLSKDAQGSSVSYMVTNSAPCMCCVYPSQQLIDADRRRAVWEPTGLGQASL